MDTSGPWPDRGRSRAPAGELIALIPPNGYLLLMSAILASLLVANLAAIYGVLQIDRGGVRLLARLFLFDIEANVPTLFNFALLATNAALFGLIGLVAFDERDRWRWHWTSLGFLFLVLAYDEAASLHERLTPLGRAIVPSDGLLFYSWVIFGAAFVLVVGLAYLRFLLALPRRTGALVTLAAALHVGGAIGIELWGGSLASTGGKDNAAFLLVATVEETLEMSGQIILGYALLRYLGFERAPQPG
jgi:hypothetical protein